MFRLIVGGILLGGSYRSTRCNVPVLRHRPRRSVLHHFTISPPPHHHPIQPPPHHHTAPPPHCCTATCPLEQVASLHSHPSWSSRGLAEPSLRRNSTNRAPHIGTVHKPRIGTLVVGRGVPPFHHHRIYTYLSYTPPHEMQVYTLA